MNLGFEPASQIRFNASIARFMSLLISPYAIKQGNAHYKLIHARLNGGYGVIKTRHYFVCLLFLESLFKSVTSRLHEFFHDILDSLINILASLLNSTTCLAYTNLWKWALSRKRTSFTFPRIHVFMIQRYDGLDLFTRTGVLFCWRNMEAKINVRHSKAYYIAITIFQVLIVVSNAL